MKRYVKSNGYDTTHEDVIMYQEALESRHIKEDISDAIYKVMYRYLHEYDGPKKPTSKSLEIGLNYNKAFENLQNAAVEYIFDVRNQTGE